jgi:hypothetical protein
LRLLGLVIRRDDDPVHVRVTHEGADPVADTVEREPFEDSAVRETDRVPCSDLQRLRCIIEAAMPCEG